MIWTTTLLFKDILDYQRYQDERCRRTLCLCYRADTVIVYYQFYLKISMVFLRWLNLYQKNDRLKLNRSVLWALEWLNLFFGQWQLTKYHLFLKLFKVIPYFCFKNVLKQPILVDFYLRSISFSDNSLEFAINLRQPEKTLNTAIKEINLTAISTQL